MTGEEVGILASGAKLKRLEGGAVRRDPETGKSPVHGAEHYAPFPWDGNVLPLGARHDLR